MQLLGFANIAAPLYQLEKSEDIEWTEKTGTAVQVLKLKLASATVQPYPMEGAHVQKTTVASGVAPSGVCELSLDGVRHWHPAAYCSRSLKENEKK